MAAANVRRKQAGKAGKNRLFPELLLIGVLLIAVSATAVSVVHTAHRSRDLNHQLAQLQREEDQSRIEYDRLLLEESAWSDPGRITKLATEKLGMDAPDPFAIVIVD